jgi:type VI secretion system protein VasD
MTGMWSNRLPLKLLFTSVILLAGCGGPPPPPPPTVAEITISAGPDINPDSSGHPAPVVLRIYRLASDTQFKALDYFQLSDSAPAKLGPDLLGTSDVTVTPGSSQVITREMKPGEQILGVTGAFRDIDHAAWRATVAVPANHTTKFRVTVQGKSVTIAKEPGS